VVLTGVAEKDWDPVDVTFCADTARVPSESASATRSGKVNQRVDDISAMQREGLC
jgi:hypothetical protein